MPLVAAAGEALVRQVYSLFTKAEFEVVNPGQTAPTGKQYFQHTALADIIGAYPLRSGLSGALPLRVLCVVCV